MKRLIYGLKQSSRCWNCKFTKFLEKFNLEAASTDPCVFVNNATNDRLILAIYVDDGLIIASSEKLINSVLTGLKKEFEITYNHLNFL